MLKLFKKMSSILILIFIITGCENESNEFNDSFEAKVLIEFNKANNLDIRYQPQGYVSTDFVTISEKTQNCNSANCIVEDYSPNSQYVKRNLNEKEKKYLELYLKESKNYEDFFSFNRVAYDAIEKINLQTTSKIYLKKVINVHHDINLFLINNNDNSISARRPCFDQCMYDSLEEIENSNWVDQLAFFVGIPESVAWLAASCAWDCRNNLGDV